MSDSQTEYPTISSVIERLTEIMKERGDLPIYVYDDGWGNNLALEKIAVKNRYWYQDAKGKEIVIEEEYVEIR